MNDLISRQAVLSLPRDVTRNLNGDIVEESIDVADIKSLPSADRPTGEWIKSHIGTIAEGYFCTNCGKRGHCEDFCPNCGAKMKGTDDE